MKLGGGNLFTIRTLGSVLVNDFWIKVILIFFFIISRVRRVRTISGPSAVYKSHINCINFNTCRAWEKVAVLLSERIGIPVDSTKVRAMWKRLKNDSKKV